MGDTSIIAENRNSQEIDNSQERNASQVDCNICHRKFRTNRGLIQHLNTCRRKNVQDIIVANDQHDGGSSREANTFVSKLSDLISVKRDTSKSCVTNWLRTKISFALLKSCLLCFRGSRSLRRNIINTNELICAASQLSKI